MSLGRGLPTLTPRTYVPCGVSNPQKGEGSGPITALYAFLRSSKAASNSSCLPRGTGHRSSQLEGRGQLLLVAPGLCGRRSSQLKGCGQPLSVTPSVSLLYWQQLL